jgi:hypothetical protein
MLTLIYSGICTALAWIYKGEPDLHKSLKWIS